MASLGGPSRSEVLSLMISFLRTSRKFTDYNIREYVKRRTLDSFRKNKQLSDPFETETAFKEGINQLEVAKRQAIVYSLYAPKLKSVMEVTPSNPTPTTTIN